MLSCRPSGSVRTIGSGIREHRSSDLFDDEWRSMLYSGKRGLHRTPPQEVFHSAAPRPRPDPVFAGPIALSRQDYIPGRISPLVADRHAAHYVLDDVRVLSGFDSDGAIIDGNGCLVVEPSAFARAAAGPEILNGAGCAEHDTLIPEAAIVFDAAWKDYYHFLVLGIARYLRFRDAIPHGVPVVLPACEEAFAAQGVGFPRSTFEAMLDLTVRERATLTLAPGLHHVGRLHLFWTLTPEPTDIVDTEGYLGPMAALGARIWRRANTAKRGQRLVVSRGLGSGSRLEAEEGERLERLLDTFRFEKVDLEAMPVVEQVEAFAGASIVIAPHGAGLANIVFCDPRCLVVELHRRPGGETALQPWFYQIASARGLPYAGFDLDRGKPTLEGLAALLERSLEGTPLRAVEETAFPSDDPSGLPEEHAAAFAALSQDGQRTYAQLGEDLPILHYLNHKRDGRYVDVGCHHPFRFSNTALLHLHYGWSGINIDADPRAVAAFRRHRPNDVNLHCAVGPTEGEAELAIFQEGAVNSVLPEIYRANRTHWGEPTMHRVRMRPLTAILDEHLPDGAPIDFLNIDVEGLDLQVVRSLDWRRYRPKVVAVEVHGLDLGNPGASELVAFMAGQGYRLGSFAVVTAVFVA